MMIFGLSRIDVFIFLSLALAKFSVGFITGMVIPIFPSLIATYFSPMQQINCTNNASFNYQQLSVLFTTKTVVQIITSPLMGYLCGIAGSVNVLFFGTLCQIATLLSYGIGQNYYLLLLGRILEAIGNSALNCAVASYVAYQYTDHKQRGLIYGLAGLSICIGGSLGPAYGGWVFQYYGKLIVFTSVSSLIALQIICIVCLLITIRSNRLRQPSDPIHRSQIIEIEHNGIFVESTVDLSLADAVPRKPNGDAKTAVVELNLKETLLTDKGDGLVDMKIEVHVTKPKHNICQFFKDPYFMLTVGSFPVIFFSLFMYLATLPQHMRLTFGATESQQGIIWMLNIMGYISGFIMGNVLNNRFSTIRHIVLMVVMFIHSLGSICIALMPTWWSVAIPLCLVVNQQLIFEIVLSPLVATIVEKNHNANYGMMSGIIMTSVALTASLGSYLGPILYSEIGFFYLNLIILLTGFAYGPLCLFYKNFM